MSRWSGEVGACPSSDQLGLMGPPESRLRPPAGWCNTRDPASELPGMRRMQRVPSESQVLAAANPIVSAATLMVDVHEDGSVSSVLGKLDLSSRRYVFTRLILPPVRLYAAGELPIALHDVAYTYWQDWLDAPWIS